MKPLVIICACALPGMAAAALGTVASIPGIAVGGIWSALICALSAAWLVAPLGQGPVAQAARMGLAFGTRLVGALVVAALIGAGRADLLVTLIACLLAAMAVEMVLLLRQSAHTQETARV